MMSLRHVLCVLTIALCCVCSCVVAADEAEGQRDGRAAQEIVAPQLAAAAVQEPGGDPHNQKEEERLKDATKKGECGTAGDEERQPCEGPPSPVAPPAEHHPERKETSESRTDLHTSQTQTASVPGVPDDSTKEHSRDQTKPLEEMEQDETADKEVNQQQSVSKPQTVTPDKTQDTGDTVKETLDGHAQSGNTHSQEAPITENSSSSVNQSSNSETENDNETGAGMNGNIAANAQSESTTNQEGNVGNTDTTTTTTTTTSTTTTTTTLPPESTNNKKGDADSSSSISSSVWVRVPLLIVFTLACILVC
ncbi:uncharacterized protein TM35_000102940 [Trypanosoma theileri]|uniref:Mucin TcMUCII n=1 Tax=Trypanosoma theileri TaxID=67003 RepID=A0A1X0NZ88_9TRYP|nr:uncharacterized protein TM35_000102940 [Trypanosoma theileri]ORC90026.1 hypothetical protein TM35_000102940 [Trypanosoma theileri]